jgi:hypothetical protein
VPIGLVVVVMRPRVGLAAALAAAAIAGCGHDSDGTRAQPAPRDARIQFLAPASVSSPPTTAIALDGPPGGIVAAEEGVWVTVSRGAHSSEVARIDPATSRIAANVPVDGNPYEIAAGEGSVWVTGSRGDDGDVLQRIDPATNRVVATLPLACCHAGPVATGEGAVWLVLTDRENRSVSLARVDPDMNHITVRVPLEEGPARHNFDELAVGMGSVWVLGLKGLDHPGDVIRVEPESNRIAATVHSEALNMGLGSGGLWITGCVDCDEHRNTFFAQEIDTGANAPRGPRLAIERVSAGPLHVGERSAWFGGYGGEGDAIAFRLDLETNAIEELLRIGNFVSPGMAFDARNASIWVARTAPASVVRVGLDSG